MGRIVIVAYRPKRGGAAKLLRLVKKHHPALLAVGLVTARKPIVARAKNGTIVEVFEWKSKAAIARAHKHFVVAALWAEFDSCATYVPIGELPEATQLFSEFDAVGR
jgi:hypothetical protein